MRNVIRVLVPVLAFGGLVLALVVSQRQREPLHVSGFVEADQIRVGSRVGGRVAELALLRAGNRKEVIHAAKAAVQSS